MKHTKHLFATIFTAYCYCLLPLMLSEVEAQNIGINTTGAVPNASAGLDIDFTTKGLLIPRLTTAQRNAIASPANSLMIYNSDCKCFQVYENGAWADMWCATGCCSAPSQPGTITGNTPVACNTTQSYNIAAVTSATSYTWSLSGGGSIFIGQGTNSINVNWTVAGTFNVSVTASNSCGTSAAQTLAVTVNGPCCTLTASAGGNQTISCSGQSVNIGGAPTASGGTTPYTYSWSPTTDLNSAILPNPTASPAATITYTVTVTDAAACTATSSVTITLNCSNTWCQKANFGGTARSRAAGFSIGTKGYIGTGSNLKDFWEWDQATNVWTQKADFGGVGRIEGTGLSIGTKGYIGLGTNTGSSGILSDFWEYDPGTNFWTQKANYGGGTTGMAVGFSIGNKGYIGTGYPGTKAFWEYDPSTDIWTQKTDFGGAGRYFAAGFSIGTKGYIGPNGGFSDFWEWDQATDVWIQKASYPGAVRNAGVGFSIGTKGYIGTGESPPTKDFYEWDQSTNVWTQKANFGGTGRYCAVGFSIGTKGYIGTGQDPSATQDFWEYCP